ncbi:MAG: PHP domain-containing protein [Endomicrobiales bacterium]|nr:PHP domain-containing protein [Endomicrobiales bacterium]
MHVHSTYSGDKVVDARKTLSKAEENGIDAVVFNDHDIMKWEYGIWPFRKLAKVSYSKKSVLSEGPAKYLNGISELQEEYPGIVLIPGVESAPFYYWTGNPAKKTLTMNNWHKHMLVIGLENPEDYKNLPLVSNFNAGEFSALKLWPLLLILIGIPYRKLRFILIACGLLLLAYNYPFKNLHFDQYSGPTGEKPYQNLIDYADSRGAVTVWAHPEARNWERGEVIGPVKIDTNPYPESLLKTFNYTGFAVFAEGMGKCGSVGGYWDEVLLEYCVGKRQKPAWAFGELDYGEVSDSINDIQNVVWAGAKTKEDILSALKAGRFFVLRRSASDTFIVMGYSVKSGKNSALPGATIAHSGNPRIYVNIGSASNTIKSAKLNFIRDGKLLKIIDAALPSEIVFEDTEPFTEGLHYYRVVVTERFPNFVYFNPVFVAKR